MGVYTDPLVMNTVFFALAVLVVFTWWFGREETKPSLQVNGHSSKTASPAFSADKLQALIQQRRSVFPKDLTGEEVSREQVEQLLEAANWAPTHGRTEPWRFVVLGKAGQQQMLDLSLKVCKAAMSPEQYEKYQAKQMRKRSDYAKVAYMLMICMKRQAKPEKIMPEWEEQCATACAMQNLQLMTTALGLGGYWSSWTEEAREAADFKRFLGLEAEDRCLGVFLLGRPGPAAGSYRSSRSPMSDKVTWHA